MTVIVTEIEVADPPAAWRRAGFDVEADDVCSIGSVGIRLTGRDGGTGIRGWSMSGLPAPDWAGALDGIPTARSVAREINRGVHPNGSCEIDHVVLFSPDLDRTVAAFTGIGVHPRRERDAELGGRPVRQIFFRLGEVVVEVVGSPTTADDGPSTLWGITYVVADIDATAAFFGDRTSPVKDAVQTGRRICTLRHRDLDITVPTAFISARRRAGDGARCLS